MNIHFIDSPVFSSMLKSDDEPKVIVSCSASCDEGRIRGHIANYIGYEEAAILFTCYTPPGSLGDRIKKGAETVRIFGQNYFVKAKIVDIQGESAHGDKNKIIRYIKHFRNAKKVFLIHGVEENQLKFAEEMDKLFEADFIVPKINEVFYLDKNGNTVDKIKQLVSFSEQRNFA
jgi:metallo-beta-lactamase family protein